MKKKKHNENGEEAGKGAQLCGYVDMLLVQYSRYMCIYVVMMKKGSLSNGAW